MKDVLIINPHAGKGVSRFGREDLLQILEQAGIDAEIRETESVFHAAGLAEDAAKAGAERVFISGGDGSVNEAVNGLVSAQKQGFTGTALGIFPNGRGNDFCDGIGMPVTKDGLTEIFRRDHRIRADVGAAGDGTFERYFINGSGYGIDSAINYYASVSPFKGKPSYAVGIVQSIFRDLHLQEAEFEIDGKTFREPFVLFAAMNGRQEGGGFRLAPDFSLTDGLLDICTVDGNLSTLQMLMCIPSLRSGNMGHPGIISMKAASVHIHLDPDKKGLFSQVDGETIIERGRDFYSRISPYKIEIICPERSQRSG